MQPVFGTVMLLAWQPAVDRVHVLFQFLLEERLPFKCWTENDRVQRDGIKQHFLIFEAYPLIRSQTFLATSYYKNHIAIPWRLLPA